MYLQACGAASDASTLWGLQEEDDKWAEFDTPATPSRSEAAELDEGESVSLISIEPNH